MNTTQVIAAGDCEIAGLPKKRNSKHAQDAEGRFFYVKTDYCLKRQESNPTWLANELLFYEVAKHNSLRMPFSSILEIDGRLYWGTEFRYDRSTLQTETSSRAELLAIACRSHRELVALCRALLLDVALLNSDRQPWNILADQVDIQPRLWFFDHEKSLLGDGKEAADSPSGDLGRIHPDSISDRKLRDYCACDHINRFVVSGLTDVEICEMFVSLDLTGSVLRLAKAKCPQSWLSVELFSRLESFLQAWWHHLRDGMRRDAAYFRRHFQ